MPICSPRGCGCSFTSETLSIYPDESNINLIHFEVADPSVITGIQDDITDIEADVATLQADITPLNALVSNGETGPDSAGPTSGTNVLTYDTDTTPSIPAAGRLHVWVSCAYTKSATADRFTVAITIDGTTVATAPEPNLSAGQPTVVQIATSGSLAIAGGSTHTINATIVRSAGSGTATVSASTQAVLHWIFIPS